MGEGVDSEGRGKQCTNQSSRDSLLDAGQEGGAGLRGSKHCKVKAVGGGMRMGRV